MQEIYYKKVGRRYVPVSIYDSNLSSAFPQGSHLVIVDGSWTVYRRDVKPEHAPVLAVAHEVREAMLKAVQEASEMRVGPVSGRKASKADEEMKDYILKHHPQFADHWLSASQVVDAAVKVLETKLMEKAQ